MKEFEVAEKNINFVVEFFHYLRDWPNYTALKYGEKSLFVCSSQKFCFRNFSRWIGILDWYSIWKNLKTQWFHTSSTISQIDRIIVLWSLGKNPYFFAPNRNFVFVTKKKNKQIILKYLHFNFEKAIIRASKFKRVYEILYTIIIIIILLIMHNSENIVDITTKQIDDYR